MIIDNSLITKSIAYGGRYTSETFNSHHKALYGNNFVVSGFALIDIVETSGLDIKLGPGVFCTSGIVVQIISDTTIHVGEVPNTPKLLVASTEDNAKDSPVSLDLLSPADVTEKMTIVGYYTPPLVLSESINTGAYGDARKAFYRPAAHNSLTEMASDVSSGLKTESILGTDINAGIQAGVNFRVHSKTIPLASEDPNLLVFYRGCLLEEATHYTIESPGTLLLKAGVTLVTENGVNMTFEQSYTNAFVDLIYAPDFLYRYTYAFVTPETPGEDYKISIPQQFSEEFSKGVFEVLVFVNTAFDTGSTLLGSDRYVPVISNSYSTSRDSIKILPRLDSLNINSGYVTEEITPRAITSFTVIGVRGLNGGTILAREDEDQLLPIVDGNGAHPGSTTKHFLETRIPYKVEAGDMQVFVDGKLSPCDHFTVNLMHPDAAPDLSDIAGQRYVSDKNSSSIEIGTIPIKYAAEHSLAHNGNQEFRVVDSINFRPNYLSPKTRDLTYGSSTFSGLKEAKDTPGITEALFNSLPGRHYDTYTSTFEFAGAQGAAFNGNYFVTYESLAGIWDQSTSASTSLFETLTMSVSMFYDVPLGVGLSLEAAHQLNFAAASGGNDAGWFYEDSTTPRREAGDVDNVSMVDPTSGLYNLQIDSDRYFSENNPIVTYAALDAHLQPWMDSFGFHEGKQAPRTYLRNAGVTYDSEGNTLTNFSDLMDAGSVTPNRSLVDVINDISGTIAANKIPIATAHGYAYGGRIINLTKGLVVPNGATSYAGVAMGDKFPMNTGMNHGFYSGHIGFQSPFKLDHEWLSSDILAQSLTDDGLFGIFSLPGFDATHKIGESAITANNLTCILSIIPSGTNDTFNHADEMKMARYRFVHLDPNSDGIAFSLADKDHLEENFTTSYPPDIGIEIVALTNGGGPGATARNALVQWTVFGKLDHTAAQHTHTGVSDEFWYKVN